LQKRPIILRSLLIVATPYPYIHRYVCTGWRRSIGCLQLQVIFRKRATNYRALFADTHISIGMSIQGGEDPYIHWYRVARRCIGCLILIHHFFVGHFLPKSPTISSSFAKRDLQFKASYASSPPCMSVSNIWRSMFFFFLRLRPAPHKIKSYLCIFSLRIAESRETVSQGMLMCVAVCCSVLQHVAESRETVSQGMFLYICITVSQNCEPGHVLCVAVCCSVLQCVAVLLQCVAVSCERVLSRETVVWHDSLLRCCSVLQCVAVCCSVLQCVAVRCNVLQCVAVCCETVLSRETVVWHDSVLRCDAVCCSMLHCVAVRCSVLQCVAVCCSVLQCVTVRCSAMQCVAVRCSVLQCVAVCCSVLQCVAVRCGVLQCVAVCCRVLQCLAVSCETVLSRETVIWHNSLLRCVAVCCGVLQCVAVCCSALQCVAVCRETMGWLRLVGSLKS